MNLLKLYYHLLVFIKNVLIKLLNEIEKYTILIIKIISKQSNRNKIIGILIICLLFGLYYNYQRTLVYICKSTNPLAPLQTLFFNQSSKYVSFYSVDNVRFNYVKSSDTFMFSSGESIEYRLNTTTNILVKSLNDFVVTYECKKN
jgi:tRNA G10  N-methylase Trm11